MNIKKTALDRALQELHIVTTCSAYQDLICPMESVNAFIDFLNREGIEIQYMGWWCHVTPGHESCGYGGPKSRHDDTWYSELDENAPTLSSNEEYRQYILKDWPTSADYRPCYTPSFWLNVPDEWVPYDHEIKAKPKKNLLSFLFRINRT